MDVHVFDEKSNSIEVSTTDQTFKFDSQLRHVAVIDLKDEKSPVAIKYEGKTWGGQANQSWSNMQVEYICSFEFDC